MDGEEFYAFYMHFLDSFTAPPVVALKKLVTPDVGLVCRSFELVLLPKPWYKGQAIMIGDAAHATTAHMGMGGSMALEERSCSWPMRFRRGYPGRCVQRLYGVQVRTSAHGR